MIYDVIVIGGGLCGLSLSRKLDGHDLSIVLLEARDRLGGRILTRRTTDGTSVEMGATWFGRKHEHLINSLAEWGIEKVEQHLGELAIYEPISTSPPQIVNLPINSDPSFRIKGGTDSIIRALHTNLNKVDLRLNEEVRSIENHDQYLEMYTDQKKYRCKMCISTIPPNLFASRIKVRPKLPETLRQIMNKTHTWMGDSIKVSLIYSYPFWLEDNTSGTIASHVGPIPEMYDQSDVENGKFALTGFFNGAYYSISKKKRLEMILKQLERYYGDKVRNYKEFEEKVWRNDSHTFADYKSHVIPHENNGHDIFCNAFLEGRLIFSGSETASSFPGYMNGALESADRAYQKVLNKLK